MTGRPTVLVTGGAGFIGGALIERLLDQAANRVVCLDKLTYAADRQRLELQISKDLMFHQVDITHESSVRELFHRYRPRLVFHLAAESHVDRSIDGPAPFIGTNVLGTGVVLGAALEVFRELDDVEAQSFRFLHASTDEVFGSAVDDERFSESTPYDPSSPYAATKAASDHLARAWNRTYGLPVLVTNCSNNYGPRQHPEKLIPHMVIRALRGESLPVYGDGRQQRDWLHVEDHVDALVEIASLGEPGETYLIGARNPLTNLRITEMVCAFLDALAPAEHSHFDLIDFVADRPGHDRRYAIDPSRLEGLGWRPRTPFSAGLEKTVRWYLDNRDWWEAILKGYDLARRGTRA